MGCVGLLDFACVSYCFRNKVGVEGYRVYIPQVVCTAQKGDVGWELASPDNNFVNWCVSEIFMSGTYGPPSDHCS